MQARETFVHTYYWERHDNKINIAIYTYTFNRLKYLAVIEI